MNLAVISLAAIAVAITLKIAAGFPTQLFLTIARMRDLLANSLGRLP